MKLKIMRAVFSQNDNQMMATVKLFGKLRNTVNASQLQISGECIHRVVENLCTENPSLYEAFLEEGQLRPHFKITLNGHDISLAGGMDTPVKDDDQLAIFSPIAGGY